jgi:hypothetical protein
MKRYLFTVLFCIATLLGLISCEEDSPSTMPKQLDFENIGGYGNIAKRVDSLIKSFQDNICVAICMPED